MAIDFRLLQNLAGQVKTPLEYAKLDSENRSQQLDNQMKQNQLAVQPELLQQQVQKGAMDVKDQALQNRIRQLDVIGAAAGYAATLPDDAAVNTWYQGWKTANGKYFDNLPETLDKAGAQAAYEQAISAKDKLANQTTIQNAQIKAQADIMNAKPVPIVDPKDPNKTILVRPYEAVGQTPAPGYGGGVTVNNYPGNPGKVFQETLAKGQAESHTEHGRSAQVSRTNISKLQSLVNMNVETGALAPIKAYTANLANSLGVNPSSIGLDKADNIIAFNGIIKDLVLQKQLAQKGPQTESDAKRIEESTGSASNPIQANKFLLRTQMNYERDNIERYKFNDAWQKKYGNLNGADDAWFELTQNRPMTSSRKDENGFPILYYDFRDKFLQANPGASEDDALKFWEQNYSGIDKSQLPQRPTVPSAQSSSPNVQRNQTQQPLPADQQTSASNGDFSSNVIRAAQNLYQDNPVLARAVAVQAMHESGSTDGKPSVLAAKYNNPFGIKGQGTAGSVRLPTTEVINGKPVKVMANFAVYNSVDDALVQHRKLMERRYPRALNARSPEEFFVNVQRGGYATDPRYAANLIRLNRRLQSVEA